MVNGTKVTLRKTFIDNLPAAEIEKESKSGERNYFRDSPRIADLFLDR